MKCAIATLYNRNVEELVKPLTENKREYCDRWGYKFFLNIVDYTEEDWENKYHRVFGYARIQYIRDLMLQYPDIDYFCWIDNDAFVMNQTISLESIIDKIPPCDFIIGEDWNGINDGVFIIKNNKDTQEFLDKVFNFKPFLRDIRPYWWVITEQCALTSLLGTIKTCIVHHSLINGYLIGPRPDNDWRRAGLKPFNQDWEPRGFQIGDFVLHLVGEHNSNKPALIQRYLQEVIK